MTLPVPAARPSPDDGAVIGFDYAALDEAQAQEAQAVAERIRSRMKANIIENGLDLISIKAQIGHGAFGTWIRAEFGMDEKTAQNYMRAASVFGGKSEIVSFLPATTVYSLAAKSTPETIREDVLRQIEEGQRPDPTVIASTIRNAKKEKIERQDAIRRAARRGKLSPDQQADFDKRAEKKAKREAKEDAKRMAEHAAKELAAQEAVRMVATRLGADFEHFAGLVAKAGWCFDSAVKAQAQEPVLAPSPVSEEKPKPGYHRMLVRMIPKEESNEPSLVSARVIPAERQTTNERLALLNGTALSTSKGVAL